MEYVHHVSKKTFKQIFSGQYICGQCPVCGLIFGSQIKAASLLAANIFSLWLKCKKGCDQVSPYKELSSHHRECTGPSGLTQILALSP